MTGTASTEASEFMDIYGLDVLEIPTNLKVSRIDEHDVVYRTVGEKSRAIVAEIADAYRRGQPVLVGTTSIEKSEQLSALLRIANSSVRRGNSSAHRPTASSPARKKN